MQALICSEHALSIWNVVHLEPSSAFLEHGAEAIFCFEVCATQGPHKLFWHGVGADELEQQCCQAVEVQLCGASVATMLPDAILQPLTYCRLLHSSALRDLPHDQAHDDGVAEYHWKLCHGESASILLCAAACALANSLEMAPQLFLKDAPLAQVDGVKQRNVIDIGLTRMPESTQKLRRDRLGNTAVAQCTEDMLKVRCREEASVAHVNLTTTAQEVVHVLPPEFPREHICDIHLN
mmetsp:Transcript_103811/g.268709  ORF Transcript_103811/g.268709 Transcript_103811/m.268709 type:complete len:237 (-) Transcript_103811:1518-2228(-)